jgi:hypothetical protein
LEKYLIIWILLGLILSIFLGYYLYYYKVKQPTKINLLLAIIRSLVFFLIGLLLINPSIPEEVLFSQKTKLSVLVDNSSSIKYFKKDSLINHILEGLKNDKKLNKKFNIDYYSFGNKFQLSDTFNFNDNQTDISIPLKKITRIQKNRNSPIVLISDGNQTIGNDYLYTKIKEPVFPIVVGDTSKYKDVKISQINVNRYSFINNKFPVETILQYDGVQPVRLRYSIENNGKIIYTKIIKFTDKNNSRILKTFIKASQEGLNVYKSKIQYLENEKNKANNYKNFSVEVNNKQSKILIVSSFYHPDLGALKKAIERDKQRKVNIEIIKSKKHQINDYQLIILYQPDEKFNLLLKQLNSNKLSFMLITGSKTDWSFINNESLGITKKNINQLENYSASFNNSFFTFSQKNIGFENFPPLLDYFGELNIMIPHQTLLFQNINGYSSQRPLLVAANENNQKKIFLFGEGIWKWRSSSFQKKNSFINFDKFIGSIVQYASNKKIRDRLDIDIKPSYNINSKILISAFYIDENFQFDNRATLLFTVLNKNTKEKKILPFSLSDSSYQLYLNSLDSGKYEYTVSVNEQDISKKGNFVVNDFLVEEQFTSANSNKLGLLAKKTKGELYFEDNYNLLMDKLVNDDQFQIEQKSKQISSNLINKTWMMLVIVTLLSLEWIIRKYIGKV